MSKKHILSDFIEASIVSMNLNASEAELEKIRAECAEQLAINEKHRPKTDHIDLKTFRARPSNDYMASFSGTTTSGNGSVLSPQNVAGGANGNSAWFQASYVSGVSATAYVRGPLTGGGAATGSIYVATWLGSSGSALTGNYVLVWGSNSSASGPWTSLGQVQVTSTTPTAKYVGYTSSTWAYVMVGTATMGGSAMGSNLFIESVNFIS
ncbi:MAG: hypothetical protein FWC33_02910 [Candidatus Bathyarchaeota archaeon]|nr:hypothetical protein [Candidatus Termiticorpusculum sp.]